jgi:hypothetical protein
MKAVRPRVPGFENAEIVLAKDQPEYVQLPALPIDVGGARGMLTRWELTAEERAEIAAGGDLWLSQMTFGHAFHPVLLATVCPIEPDSVVM